MIKTEESLGAVHTHTHTHTHTPYIYGKSKESVEYAYIVKSNNLKNLVVLIRVAKNQKRNINIKNRDRPLCSKARRNICFAAW